MSGESGDMKMKKYEVWATVWSSELLKRVNLCVGSFDEYFNANLFATAYCEKHNTSVDIITLEKSATDHINDKKIQF